MERKVGAVEFPGDAPTLKFPGALEREGGLNRLELFVICDAEEVSGTRISLFGVRIIAEPGTHRD
jgi:hypothetical protein